MHEMTLYDILISQSHMSKNVPELTTTRGHPRYVYIVVIHKCQFASDRHVSITSINQLWEA